MNIETKPLAINHAKGRSGKRPDVLVIHIMEGTLAGTDSWFRNPAAKVSAHYGVSRDGHIVQWVSDDNTAWHAGSVIRPTAPIVLERPGVNPNSYSIGIENEGFAHQAPTPQQLASLVELVVHLSHIHAIPLLRRHIVGHREIRADKTCPGLIDVDAVVALARSRVADERQQDQTTNAEVEGALEEIERQVSRIRAKLWPGK